MMNKKLIEKYNVPGPRYTSYPVVPHWDTTPSQQQWIETLDHQLTGNEAEVSLYIHLPFCESLCTYCGCNKKITANHSVERPYIDAVHREWDIYTRYLQKLPVIKEIHLGGGTPTFFSAENLKFLINGLLQRAKKSEDFEISVEGHPNNTTYHQLEVLHALGCNRVSFGIQDFDNKVQVAIHRIQSYEQVQKVTKWAHEIGYTSVNYDLIYGLPFQTKESIRDTISKVKQLQPGRIAFYSYAHVPWKSKSQRLYSENDLPNAGLKQEMYELGSQLLRDAGYHDIGMDHFALPEDELSKAAKEGKLYRNFMGYTLRPASALIGLGVSSISDGGMAYVQNEKTIAQYKARINKGELPITKGHLLSEEDQMIRHHIMNLMCRFKTVYKTEKEYALVQEVQERLAEFEEDGLLVNLSKGVLLTDTGKRFVRNICMAFDKRLREKATGQQVFSKAV